jgi:outer membrane protein assembly factor BamE (lipoprotein component of BamABCDE complex)
MRRGRTTRQSIEAAGREGSQALRIGRGFAVVVSALLLAGCAEQITKHGHQFHANDLQQIQPGMGQEQVRLTLGTPTTTTTSGDGSVFYYISSTTAQTSFLLPKETDRQVVAIYMTPTGTVDHVANYGLKDGKVFDFVSRTTPAPGSKDEGILKQLFRNLGTRQIFGE